jgi:signal peptidase I
MAETLIPGDFILVNLAAYKLRTPGEIPFISSTLEQLVILKTGEPKINDLVIFKLPFVDDNSSIYANPSIVKRIIAGPGDTLQIIDKIIIVNGSELSLPPSFVRNYQNVKESGLEDKNIFYSGSGWNSDNYGPIVIPSRGDTLTINNENIHKWQHLIFYEYGKKVVRKEGSVITIDGLPSKEYIVQKDQYFVIGDNFNNSHDSRYFGFINEDMIVGRVMFIYWSTDTASGIRWDRIFNLM